MKNILLGINNSNKETEVIRIATITTLVLIIAPKDSKKFSGDKIIASITTKNAEGRVKIRATIHDVTDVSSGISNFFAKYAIPKTGQTFPGMYLPKLVM